ncbi:hypothetical protein BDQ94DRAFT_164495 [Aspergillus welwitschiae]|uniref:Uncharacterized protein n=1 Tax=Aspergillus welwitschiae TaxID=1341132 RepID=A0A3F3PJ92_9EURO|nr:hypothetical protein BDQ94DRAFT_164495 [Aspergillus welwitschiae]RDH26436.1 hypothetical protein BDQ94DRAFT_164495 [Aspergillus welwitschiae]
MASYGRVALCYDPLHRERCIGLLDNGHPCPQDVDLKWREIAHTQLQLLQDMTDLTARESCLNSITKHLLCDSHRRILARSTKHRHISPMVQKQSQPMVQEAPSRPLPRLVGGIIQVSIGGPVLQRTELPSILRH